MQLRNIRPHSQYRPGDVVEIPDGDAFDGFCWEAVSEPPAAELPPAAVAIAVAGTPLGRELATDDARAAEGLPPLAPVQFPAPKEM